MTMFSRLIRHYTLLPCLLLVFILFGCDRHHQGSTPSKKGGTMTMQGVTFHYLPPLFPQESLKHFKLADKNLTIKLVAAEPLIHSPVVIKFDAKGRIWVVEMRDYMLDAAGTSETKGPAGDIVILSDRNHDGRMDHRKVFMDSLLLPRAISFYGDGLLVAETPKLLFVENNHGSAGKVTVVDSNYAALATGGWASNVELQANGLLRGLDNWIYSAYSNKRYRRINGKWVIKSTHFRGQWELTQDNYGRLFYTHNNDNLNGDYFLPSLGAWNSNQTIDAWDTSSVSGFVEHIVKGTWVYPIHPTPGADVGYTPGALDDSLRLKHFTAATGPLIYRGGALGPKYEGNAFVCGPVANIVKLDVLQKKGFHVSGKEAYQGKEFLASDDERFRPVYLKVGPDGALYIVDMYQGIIQDKIYVTSYLRKQIKKRNLKYPQNWGRIYKVVPKGETLSYPDLGHKPANDLINLLDNPNSWVRKTAQRLLVDGKEVEAEDQLRQKMQNDSSLLGKIHAFWTLEGLGKLRIKDIQFFLHSGQPKLKWEAIAAAAAYINGGNAEYWLQQGGILFAEADKQFAPYVGFLAAAAAQYAPKSADDLLLKLALRYKNDPYVSDAVISGLYGREEKFLQQFQQSVHDTSSVFYHHLKEVIAKVQQRKQKPKTKKKKIMSERFLNGKRLFGHYCSACHGTHGSGMIGRGAPLGGSQWVTGDKQILLGIVLNGLHGPIKVGNKIYQKPEVSGIMPSFGGRKQISDKEFAQLLSYIRNAWGNEAGTVSAADVRKARKTYKGRDKPFTMDELKQLKEQLK